MTDRQTDTYEDREAEDREIQGQGGRMTDRQTDTYEDREAEGQTDIRTGRPMDRQI